MNEHEPYKLIMSLEDRITGNTLIGDVRYVAGGMVLSYVVIDENHIILFMSDDRIKAFDYFTKGR